jgi:electron transfer flavoprotein alpha subunit
MDTRCEMDNVKNVLILVETKNNNVLSVSYELITAGRKLADGLKRGLTALILDDGVSSFQVDDIIKRGVDVVYRSQGLSLIEGNDIFNIGLLEKLVRKIAPCVFLMSGSDLRNLYACSLAGKLETSVLTNCTNVLTEGEGSIIFSKIVYCGKAIASYEMSSYPNIVTIKWKSFPASNAKDRYPGQIEEIKVTLPNLSSKMKLIETVTEEENVQLEGAKIIVCAGGGIGGMDGLAQVAKLAEALNGVVGFTKVPCDEGWIPRKTYIGQTGKTVSPDLYIAVGVSGATQHMTGVLGSKCIVAVNRDREAPVFKYSNYGIVGDYKVILPLLIREFGDE